MTFTYYGSVLATVLILLLYPSQQADVQINELRQKLQESILANPFFRANFSNFNLLHINPDEKNVGVDNFGEATTNNLERLFQKALTGKNVSLLVLGGSSSLGADLGPLCGVQTYHVALTSWWNRVIFPITGSFLTKRLAAVGGIGTAYMSLCWKEYIKGFQDIDLMLSEFFINDPDITLHTSYDQSLKRFLQSIHEYVSCPALIFVKFCKITIFPGKEITCLVTNPAFRLHLRLVQENLKAFEITSINFQSIICNILKTSHTQQLRKNEYFISHHPSHLAHAQIGYSLTNHIRNQFLQFLDGRDTVKQHKIRSCYNNNILNTVPESICYTGILPNPTYQNLDLIYSLPKGWINGFKMRKPINGTLPFALDSM